MAKKNKKKDQAVDTAHQVKPSSSSSSFTSSHDSSARKEGLEDLDHSDHSDNEHTPLTTAKTSKQEQQQRLQKKKATPNKSNTTSTTTTSTTTTTTSTTTSVTATATLKSLLLTERETALQTTAPTSVWSWLSSSRTVSDVQLEYEAREEKSEKADHERRLVSTLGLALPQVPQKPTAQQGGVHLDDDDDLEKKQAKYSWDHAKMLEAFDLTRRDWIALSTLTVATLGVRLWRISWPDEVVLDEAHIGRHINGYIKNEFTFDPHPPLGKLLLAGVSSALGYEGTFAFNEIGDTYPGEFPYVALRMLMAFMGSLCSPMAYVTLKATGQSASAALVAGTLVAFDNALTANNRLVLLDAPLMFFVAATFMCWNMFAKQSPRPFTGLWWTWLIALGLSMAGAMSTKLVGFFTATVTVLLSTLNIWQLAREDSVTKPEMTNSPQAEYELDMLSRPYRHSLVRQKPLKSMQGKEGEDEDDEEDDVDEDVWSDVVFGSVIQLQSEYENPGSYLHSFAKQSPVGSRQQQVGGYNYPDLNTHWIVIRPSTDEWEKEEIPSRIQYLKNDDIIRLRHVPTRRCLHSHEVRSPLEPHNKELCEVTGYGGPDFDGDSNDWWVVEVVDEKHQFVTPARTRTKVKALHSLIRLRHYVVGCHLYVSDRPLPDPWGEGRREITCRKEAGVTPRTTWRITMNDHDNLPQDTPLASYPEMTFWKKLVETHKMMFHNPDLLGRRYEPSASRPTRWPLAMSMIPAWASYMRQLTIVANPVVWWTGTLGVLSFIATAALFALREKRGYFESGRARDLKHFHLNDATLYFVGWAAHYVPFFFMSRTLFMHHYFPSLYLSILVACSLFSGVVGYLPRPARLAVLAGCLMAAITLFVHLSPLSYASPMSREKCEAIRPFVNSLGSSKNVDHRLDCSNAPPAAARTKSLWDLKKQVKRYRNDGNKAPSAASATKTAESLPLPTAAADAGGDIVVDNNSPQNHGYPPIPTSAAGSPPIEFLTSLPPHEALARYQQQERVQSVVVHEYLRGQVRLVRPEVKTKSPILAMNFPAPDERLPMQHVFMSPYQRPPQLWDLDVAAEEAEKQKERELQQQQQQQQQQKEKEQQQQKQQKQGKVADVDDTNPSANSGQDVTENKKQEEVPVADQEENQNDETEQEQVEKMDSLDELIFSALEAEAKSAEAGPNFYGDGSGAPEETATAEAPVPSLQGKEEEKKKEEEVKDDGDVDDTETSRRLLEQREHEEQIDRLLEKYKAKQRVERKVRAAVARNKAEHDAHQHHQHHEQDGEPDVVAATTTVSSENSPMHTSGLALPGKYPGRPNFAAREKMMKAALEHARTVTSQRRASVRSSIKNPFLNRRGTIGAQESLSMRRSMESEYWAEQMEYTSLSILQEMSMYESDKSYTKSRMENDQEFRASVMAQEKLAKERASRDWLELLLEEREKKKKERKASMEEENEPQEAEDIEGVEGDNDGEDSGIDVDVDVDADADIDNGNMDEEEVEVRGPPIQVGSPEELERVLQQLQAEGVRAEVVRGTVTHTIEPPIPSIAYEEEIEKDADIVVDTDFEGQEEEVEREGDEGEQEEKQEKINIGQEDSNNHDDDDDDEEEEDSDDYNEEDEVVNYSVRDSEGLPPIAVKNADELASVLNKLGAQGIRAEVVRGTATRYVEPPPQAVVDANEEEKEE
ncbi:hypothetical protein BGZ94_010248 [Podila epigama]|nr:hypothetical protein BGZ94_010248 [Podila epigama]